MSESVTVIDIVAQITDQTDSGAKSATENVSKLEKSMRNVQGEINKMQKMSKLELTMYAVDKASKGINSVMGLGKNIAGKVWNVTLKAIDLVTAPIRGIINLLKNPVIAAAGIAGISLGVGDTINTFANFEQGMANIKAITGAADSEISKIEQGIRQISLNTGIDVGELAENSKMLAEFGGDFDLMMEQLAHGATLANATGTGMATTLDFLGSTMKTFGIEAEDTQSVVDSFALVTSLANVELNQLAEAYVNAGGAAAAAGVGIDEMNAMLIQLSNAGLKGGSAGTSLNAIFRNLSTPTDKAAAVLSELGVSLYEIDGSNRNMIDIMSGLENSLSGMSDEASNAAKSAIFDEVALKGWNMVISDGINEIKGLAKELGNASDDFGGLGQAAGISKTRMDTIQGSFKFLKSAVNDFKLTIGEKAEPYIKQFVGWLTEKVPQATEYAVKAFDWVERKIKSAHDAVKSLTNSTEWQNAEGIWAKIGVAWNKLIAEPFDEWWSSGGKTWLSNVANTVGRGLGSALNAGISALFGLDINGAVDDGLGIGKSFADGFSKGIEGIDWGKVAEGLKNALMKALELVFSNPITGGIATAWIGGKVLSGVSGGYKAFQGAKGIWDSLFSPSSFNESGLVTKINGDYLHGTGGTLTKGLGRVGSALGSGATTLGGSAIAGAAGLAGIALGAAGIISAVSDFSKAAKTYNNLPEKVSGGVKLGLVASGAVIGGILAGPIGAAVGAGVGGLVALVAGSQIGGAIAGWIDGTSKIYKTTEELEKASAAYDDVMKKAGDTKTAIQDYYEATEALISGNIGESAIEETLEKQKSALETITQDLYPGLITKYDIEHGRLEDKLKLIEKISEEEQKQAKFQLESAVVKGRENIIDTKSKIAESEAKQKKWADEEYLAQLYLPEVQSLQSQYRALVDLESYIDEDEFNKQMSEIESRANEISKKSGIEFGMINLAEANDPRYGGYARTDATSLFTNKISKLQASIEKEQETLDKLNYFLTTQYEIEIKLMDINYGGGLLEDLEAYVKFTEKGVENLSESEKVYFEELEKNILGPKSQIEELNKQIGDIPDRIKTFYEIEIDLTNPEVLDRLEKLIRIEEFAPDSKSPFKFDGFNPEQTSSAGFSHTNDMMDIILNPPKADSAMQDSIDRIINAEEGHADGGYFTSAHEALISEDGPEFIIPVGAKRRQRGLELWKKAGQMLGVNQQSDMTGGTSATGGSNGSGGVTVENITIDIRVDGSGSPENTVDELARSIALKLQQAFANMPLAAERN